MTKDNLAAWIAHALPRRVVMAALLRATLHCITMRECRGWGGDRGR